MSKIIITKRDGNWVLGTIDGKKFTAKVYEENSEEFGINGGNISKLWIEGTLNFDRGWDERPKTTEAKAMLKEIKNFFKGWKM